MFGLCLAVKEGLFYRDLLFDLSILGVGPTVVWIDSQGALHLSLDPVAFKKTKHILRACEFVRDHVAKLRFACRHLAGDIMIADILTKATASPIFIKLSQMVHVKMDDTYVTRSLPDEGSC